MTGVQTCALPILFFCFPVTINALQITFLNEQINFQTKHNLSKKEQLLSTYTIALSSKEPTRELKECYAQVVKSGKKIALEKIEIGDEFELQTPQSIVKAKALEKVRSESWCV